MLHGELRRLRLDSGLTLAEVARAAGTATPNLSAYECGRKRPSPVTEQRLLAAVAAGAASPIHRFDLLTVPAAAAALRRAIRQGWSTADCLRLLREMRSNASHLEREVDVSAFYSRPSTTGDARWDVLVAGVAELDALIAGRVAPSWVDGRSLDAFWFVSPSPSFDAYAFAHTPPSLLVRGIVLDGAELESV